MKLKAATRIILTLFLANMLITAFDVAHTADEPTVHNIDTDLDYKTIQDAINAPETLDGHTIQVDAGIYFEHVTVDKSVKLVGEDRSNTIIDGSGTGTVVVVKANNVDISGFTIRNNEWGIQLQYLANNVISENIVKNSTYGGIYLGDSSNNTISGNTLTSNRYGLWLERSDNNVIIGNTVTENLMMGISLAVDSNDNTVRGNIITNNDEGIHLFSSFNNIYENTITNSWYGIFSLHSGDNLIYRNNFIENTKQASLNESYVDVWDNGAEGNYWSDYNGLDVDGDGIGDSDLPYQGLDWHPLMEPWSQSRVFDVIWEEEKYQVTTFSNSTIANLNFNSSLKQISFNVTGPLGAVGFCNVTVPKSLLRDPWLILLDEANVTASTVIFETGTHTFFYLSYGFSTHTVKIIGTDVFDKIPPVANAGPNQTVDEDTLMIFNGSLSYDNIGITNYTWTFTDETPQTLTGVNPTYTFANPGTYTVTLNVSDGARHYSTDTVVITVLDVTKPVADAGLNKTIVVNTEVEFNASGSSDNVGIVSYEWDFGDGFSGTGITTTHRYANSGTYHVTLTVKDAANNTSTDSITVTVLSYLQAFRWWIVGAVAFVGIAVAGIIFWKRKARKNVT